ncbi:MAG: ribulose-phosphate 3-epimerase [Candidatus Omnitrophota bacterium]|nr:MAG: ribulose-phosphate 3-epimerase [Candidatus Omnitrophota bacterium]
MKRKIKVSPSVIAADQARLGSEVRRIEKAGADLLHIDIMDGHFVPNITIGPDVVSALDKITQLPLDVHLMISNPKEHLEAFAQAGADYITVHIESCKGNAGRVISRIKSLGKKAGVSLNPSTPLSAIKKVLKDVDMVLVMTVEPGFCGQKFMLSVVPKIKSLRKIFKGDIAVDGGINQETAGYVISCGANILASGSHIFKAKNPRRAIEGLRRCQKK